MKGKEEMEEDEKWFFMLHATLWEVRILTNTRTERGLKCFPATLTRRGKVEGRRVEGFRKGYIQCPWLPHLLTHACRTSLY